MKDISMYVRGICNSAISEKNGKYITILNYERAEKIIKGFDIQTTSNRMVITGLIQGLRALKESCNITAYIQCNIGIKKGLKGKKGVNKDLLDILFEEVNKGNHKIEFIITEERQRKLSTLI